jgi:hypothetical protein
MANVKIETIAIKLIIKKAIALGFASALFVDMSSINLKSVFEDLHEKIKNKKSGMLIARITMGKLWVE